MEDTMTVDEIVERYPDEWVLIGYPDLGEDGQLYHKGTLLFHSPDRKAVYSRADRWEAPVQSVKFTGRMDPNVVYVL